jgi:hypothetical protein
VRRALSAALAGEWVSAKERYPEVGQEVMVVILGKVYPRHLEFMGMWKWRDEYGHDYDDQRDTGMPVTHWRKLPNPPAMDATREGEG